MACKLEIPMDTRFADIPDGIVFGSVAQARSWLRQEGSTVQTVICSKDRFDSVSAARSWVSEHGFRTDKVDVTDDSYRFRQFDPGDCAENALSNGETFATITLDRGVKAVVCKKKSGRSEEESLREIFPAEDAPIRHADFAINARRVTIAEVREKGFHPDEDEEDEEKDGYRIYEVAISSEAEIERWFGIEVLGHGEEEVDMMRLLRGAAVLVDHRGDQVGVVMPGSARIDADKVLRGYVRFSRSARGREIEDDVDQEIRTSISVGYFIKNVKLVEVREVGKDSSGRAVTIDVYRATRWQPAEVSLVSVPADVSVGVGRSQSGRQAPGKGGKPAEGAMKKVRDTSTGKIVEAPDDDPRPAVKVMSAERDKQVAEILDICDYNKIDRKQAREWIAEGLSVDEVSVQIIRQRKTTGEAQPHAELLSDVPEKERKRYSYARAIVKAADMREGRGKFDGLEAEMHEEIDRKLDVKIERRGGFFAPLDLRSEEDRLREFELRRRMQFRALDSKTVGKGIETIFEEAGELIEILRQTAVATRLGARMFGGLTAPVAFPKHTGRLSAFWVGENPTNPVTASDLGFGLVNLSPKTIQATTSYSRQFLVQSTIDGEGFVRSELGEEHALLLDRSLFHGKGASGEPTGIYQAPDVNVRAVGGVPDLADVVDAMGLVADDNALAGALGIVTTPLLAAKMRQTPEHATLATAGWLWQGTILEGEQIGYRAMSSNQISKTMLGSAETGGSEHGWIFGNWRESLIGLFAALELIVDPFALKKFGMIEVTSFQMADIVLRHGESFVKWTGATTV